MLVHVAVLAVAIKLGSVPFASRTGRRTVVAMGANFNSTTRSPTATSACAGRLWRGLMLFMLVCGRCAAANVGIARALYVEQTGLDPGRRRRRGDRPGMELRGLGDVGVARPLTLRSFWAGSRV